MCVCLWVGGGGRGGGGRGWGGGVSCLPYCTGAWVSGEVGIFVCEFFSRPAEARRKPKGALEGVHMDLATLASPTYNCCSLGNSRPTPPNNINKNLIVGMTTRRD